MLSGNSSVDFVGTQPDVVGHVCTGLAVQHFYDGKSVVDQANATYFRFSGNWHRICFEKGTVFWRSDLAPQQPVNSTLGYGLLLNDLSELPVVSGRKLLQVDYSGTEAGDVEARFLFEGDAILRLRYSSSSDSTQIDA